MPISFANIPANIKVPMYYVEVDPSMAGLPSINLIALLTGIMLASYQSVETAVVASGGSGYTAGNTIDLGNGVVVTVDTVTAGAVATATLTDPGTIAADATPPANPVPQVSSSGGGTGATFTLTWQTTSHPNAGTATPNVPVPVGSQAMADQFFGAGSELSRMFQAFYSATILPTRFGLCRWPNRRARRPPLARSSLPRRRRRPGRCISISLGRTSRSTS